jgi:hypothetical protein
MAKKTKRISSRDKGHTFERFLASQFRESFPKCSTSRASSKALDDCKIDLNNIPFNVQAKCGYETTNFNFFELKKTSITLLKEAFTGAVLDQYLNNPYVLIHKKKVGTKVEIEFKDFINLVKKAYA